MKPLRICAMAVLLLGAGGWDAALPVTLGIVGLSILGGTILISAWIQHRQRKRQAVKRRMVALRTRHGQPAGAQPEFADAAETLARIAAPPAAASPWQVEPQPEAEQPPAAPAGAQIISLERFRLQQREASQAIMVAPLDAAEMQRRLTERAMGLRQRHEAEEAAITPTPDAAGEPR